MAGTTHSVIASIPDTRLLKLTRDSVPVSAEIEGAGDGYIRAIGGGPVVDGNGISISNPSLGSVNYEVHIITPFGTYLERSVSIGAGNTSGLGALPLLPPGYSIRITVLPTSDVGAYIDVIALFADFDTMKYVIHELQDDWTDVLEVDENKSYCQFNGLSAWSYADQNGTFEMRLLDENNVEFPLFGSPVVFTAGEVTENFGIDIQFKRGQRLQARKLSGSSKILVAHAEADLI